MIGSAIIDAQRQSLELVTDIQGRVVKANRELAESLAGMVDTMPLPDFKAPALFDAEFVGQAFDLTAEWLEASRHFTEDLVAAWMPEASKPKAKK
ncbi:MAG: hypothetical protein OER95_07035 [Acidimicrobiia bacterium]|nr:hypothetical protein [Acidimicrobiia bacterium]